jgi:hypothetical protein
MADANNSMPGSKPDAELRSGFAERAKDIASLIRDIGLILGVPALIGIGVKLYDVQISSLEQQIKASDAQLKIANEQFSALKAQIAATEADNRVLKETQYDRALSLIESQKKLYETDRAQVQKEIESIKHDADEKSIQIKELRSVIKCEKEITKTLFSAITRGDKENSNGASSKLSDQDYNEIASAVDAMCIYNDTGEKSPQK